MNAANDILIIGGGVIGLAIAVELKLRGRSRHRCQPRFQTGIDPSRRRNASSSGRRANG
jgi:glycine/D-amino acid oxidase-like deaminating enzyme